MSDLSSSAAIRARLPHPVIDADGHIIEFLPAVRDHLVEVGGRQLAEDFDTMMAARKTLDPLPDAEKRAHGLFKLTWWAYPARNSRDRATGMLPQLLYERLDEFGIDFAVMYPTAGLAAMGLGPAEMRTAAVRAFNRCAAEMFEPYADRLTPVAMIPMNEPGEAIDELEYCKNELGLKAFLLNGIIHRPLGPDLPRAASWVDTFGPESPYDYDPVWAKCVELGAAPTFHASAMGWGSRISQSNYVYNHLGNFAHAGEATCRSLFMHGVPQRFPELRCAFLEGGMGWACSLYADLIGHFEKRGLPGLHAYDPDLMDRELLEGLFRSHGSTRFKKHLDELEDGLRVFAEPQEVIDDFAAAQIEKAEDIRTIFERNFRFGCEADDPLNATAFDTRMNPLGARLGAIFSSDIGHWDVPEMSEVLAEAWELVDRGLLGENDFRDFTFTHAASMWAEADAHFFKGTSVEKTVAQLMG
ncbi:amidohydrolase family protein [Myxococcota bacterium]|nr:amidohydrolase family protein [Myxococcota bacterium]